MGQSSLDIVKGNHGTHYFLINDEQFFSVSISPSASPLACSATPFLQCLYLDLPQVASLGHKRIAKRRDKRTDCKTAKMISFKMFSKFV